MSQGRNPPLYTPEERRRRDASPWTLVQGILAPIQFVVFLASLCLASLCLVLRYLTTGEGLGLATASVVVKTRGCSGRMMDFSRISAKLTPLLGQVVGERSLGRLPG